MVREFYPHLTTPKNAFVYVRGKSMLFDKEVINSHYCLKNTIDEHTPFIEAIDEEGLKKVLQDLPGTQWIMSKQDSCTIHRKSLNHAAKYGTILSRHV